MRISVFFIIFFVTLGFDGNAQINLQNYKRFTKRNGLSDNRVKSLIQDKEGFIWIGTESGGLNRFDGHNFLTFKNNPLDSNSIANNAVNSIAEDGDGSIWIANMSHVSKYDQISGRFTQYSLKSEEAKEHLANSLYEVEVDSDNNVFLGDWIRAYEYNKGLDSIVPLSQFDSIAGASAIKEYKGNIWIGTYYDGLIRYNPINKSLVTYSDFINKITSKKISYPLIDINIDEANNLIWIVYRQESKYRLVSMDINNPNIYEIHKYINDSDEVNPGQLFKDSNNIYWILWTGGGFTRYRYEGGRLLAIDQNVQFKTETFTAVIEDKEHSIWLASNSKGLLFFPNKGNNIQYYGQKEGGEKLVADKNFTSIALKGNELWCSMYDEGLCVLDLENNRINQLDALNNQLFGDDTDPRIRNLVFDKNGILWIVYKEGIIRLNIDTHDFEKIGVDFGTTVYSGLSRVVLGDDGTLWAASENNGKLLQLVMQSGNISKLYDRYYSKGMPGYYPSTMRLGHENRLYLGFRHAGLYEMNVKENIFKEITTESGLRINEINSLLIDGEILWVGTQRGLLKKNLTSGKDKLFTTADGLLDDEIVSLLFDKKNNLWASSPNGVSMLNIEDGHFKGYEVVLGFKESFFNRGAMEYDPITQKLFFGGKKGVWSFGTKSLNENTVVPTIAFSKLYGYKEGQINYVIDNVDHLETIALDYAQKDFTVEFSALSYIAPGRNQYAYKLEGYHDDWIYSGNKNDVTFTNLPPGNYNLLIKGSNNDGLWNETGKTLAITIRSPWWLSDLAYTGYILMGLLVLYWYYLFRKRKVVAIQLKKMDVLKDNMFTYISHEFRTPLTMILGVEESLRDYAGDTSIKGLQTIKRNGEHLLHLVNDILEIRRIKSSAIAPKYVQDDILSFIRYYIEPFEVYAATRGIRIHSLCDETTIVIDYDPEKFSTILSNLLSNAIKHTPDEGDIYLRWRTRKGKFNLKVTDTGPGISQKDLPYVFDSFYSNPDRAHTKDSFGVGLALTKELVELMNGQISVSTELGKGSSFFVALPITNKAKVVDWLSSGQQLKKFKAPFGEERELTLPIPNPPSSEKRTVLIIEDNIDVLNHYASIFKEEWHLLIAQNGKDGIKKAIEQVPDIVVTDLIMPEMDGHAVVRELRKNELTNHIPIIVMSANGGEDARLSSWKFGADSHMTKPFNKKILLARMDSLIKQRGLIHQKYIANHEKNAPLKTTGGLDIPLNKDNKESDPFLVRLEEQVLANSQFNTYTIEELCADLRISRTQLHNKVKALTGMTTSKYIRSIRLKKAMSQLQKSDRLVSDVAYEVGFSDSNYFTRCFKEEYGISPTEV